MRKWPCRKLSGLLHIQNGYAFKSELFNSTGVGLPIIRIRDLARGYSETCYNGAFDKSYLVHHGDFLIGMDGEFRCYRWGESEALLNQRVCRLKNFSKEVLPAYVFYGINRHLEEIEANTSFVTVKHLSSSQIGNIELPLPPLPEQERIVKLLDEADALRKLRTRADKRSEELIPALFEEMFGDPIGNPKRWPTLSLSSIVDELRGGRSINPAGAEEALGQYRVLKISAVTSGEYKHTESKPVSADYRPPQLHFVKKGDLLFSRANTAELVGATVYVFETPPNLLLPDKLWRFVWKEPKEIVPLFIWHTLQSKSVRHEIGNRATGTGGSMKNISKPKVLSLAIPWPPLKLQLEFASHVSQIRSLFSTQSSSRQNLDALFQSMLHRAFRGEL
jgi:type I restriction enzyme S subunit